MSTSESTSEPKSEATTLPERGRTINWPRMRPRFTVELGCSADHVMGALRSDEFNAGDGIEGTFSEHHGVLTLPEAERQFWSTHLGLTIEVARKDADGQTRPTRVLGVFSPQPEVWTAYVFAVGILMLIGASGLMFAVVQLTLGHAPWGLVASLIAVLVGALVYTSTLVGQGLAAAEMYRLRSHLDDCLEAAEARARRAPATARESAQL